MTDDINELIHEYGRRCTAHDAAAVAELCLSPFLALRGESPIHLNDPAAVQAHYQQMMDTFHVAGAETWLPITVDCHPLGDHAAFATVRWNALDADRNVCLDTTATYHVLLQEQGWRFLSYTIHS